MNLLVVEDGTEYQEFARVFLSPPFTVLAAQSGAEACRIAAEASLDGILMDLRFDRSPPEDLLGDVPEIATRLYGGDATRAMRYLKDQQGTFILAALREAECETRTLFIHDFSPRRLANLRRLYRDVVAVPSFDAAAILATLHRS